MKSQGLVRNILALGVVQVLGYLVPLLIIPYLTRTLGTDAWGKVAFSQAVSAYLIIVANWGFNISATQKIAAHLGNERAISRMASAAWGGQAVLTLFVAAAYLIAVFFVDRFRVDVEYHIYVCSNVLVNAAFPIWLYIGMERIKEVAAIQLISKVLTVPLIFLFVHQPADGPLVIAATTITGLVGAIATFRWLRGNSSISLVIPRPSEMAAALREGAPMFFSAIAMSLYSTFPQILLGALSSTAQVGVFALADRVRQVAQSAYAPITQALFPRMSSLFEKDREAAVSLIWRSSKYIVMTSSFVSAVLFFGADLIIQLLSGAAFQESAVVLRALAFVPLIVSIANILGVQVMLANGRSIEFSKIVGYAGLGSLLVTTPMIIWLQSRGAAIAILLVEGFVLAGFAFCVRKARLLQVR